MFSKLLFSICLIFVFISGYSQTSISSVQFDGIDGHINMGDPINGSLDFGASDPFTMMAWIKTTATPSTYIDIISKRSETLGNHEEGYMMAVNSSGTIYFVIEDVNGLFTQMNGSIVVNDGNWHFITATRNVFSDNVNVYVDGVLDISLVDNTTGVLAGNMDFYIGRWPYYGRYFDGEIDDISIWNTAMNLSQINDYMSCPPVGTEPNLISLWNFEETDSIAYDITSNANNGIITSGANHIIDAPIFNCRGVQGFIYHDINQNCVNENFELGLNNRLAIINPGNIIVETGLAGTWYLDSLDAGSYTITFDTSGNWTTNCATSMNFTVIDPNQRTYAPSFGMYSTQPCSEPSVSVNMPFIRRCFPNQKIYVQACNESFATDIITNGYVDLELDPLLTPTTSSLSYTSQGNDIYRFYLTNTSLYPGQCESFWVSTDISCNAVLNQTICTQANLYPADSCVFDTIPADSIPDFTPCSLPWDQSSISVDGWCDNDTIYFTITNTGDPIDGDMECYSPVRLYIDGDYIYLDSIMLTGGDVDTLIFAGDGRTWRLEVDQHPLHPGNSHPNAVVELCGNAANWTPNLVNTMPLDDADPVVDIYCGLVTGSYDPNDKTGYPLGIGPDHWISPNGKLDYVIRFQNTGTDTAFTIVVRDTLDMDLNIYSVNSGVASNPYSFRMYGPRVLEWTFNNILLPDSTTDEPGSHGFVTFSVNQMPNLPDGTEINNVVGIYFDYNDPIITNTTSHIIMRDISTAGWSSQLNVVDTACFSYNYGTHSYNTTGQYYQVLNDTLVTIDLTVNTPMVSASTSADSICREQSIILSGSGADSYIWTGGAVNNQNFTPLTSEIFYVTGTDSYGCQDSDSVYVYVQQFINAGFESSMNGTEITLQDTTSGPHSIQWELNGIPISSQPNLQYNFTQNGTYNMCLVVTDNCSTDTQCLQVVINGLGINDSEKNEIKLFPNPVTSILFFELPESSLSKYVITDAIGNVVMNGELKGNSLDINKLANGLYFIQIENQGMIYQQKFIKN